MNPLGAVEMEAGWRFGMRNDFYHADEKPAMLYRCGGETGLVKG
jgi:hypothetical protein